MFYQNVRLRASVNALYPWKISFKQFLRKKAVRNTPICWRCFWIPKTEDSLPVQFLEINREMPQFDFQALGFSTLKNPTLMAETFSFLTVRFDGQNSPIPVFRAVDTIFSSGLPPPKSKEKWARAGFLISCFAWNAPSSWA
jgi:hypothetical protein